MAKLIRAYNTRTGKYQEIHPTFKNDKAYLSQRGLIIQTEPKPIEVTNSTAPELSLGDTIPKTTNKKQTTNK